jgi:diaminohydroxyphosphoribosylaminopyrimidine deaminase / 5-amino-6-(5-phosphoribosylamino)uracil reductase
MANIVYFCSLTTDEKYMYRCLQLAALGKGYVAPNPFVGAVLVHNDIIIGEGYHQQYGQAHAEINCINSVSEYNKKNIAASTLYVSLEPCAHFGKTPPCANAIINHQIPRVVVGCTDSFAQVNGKGIATLKAAGISVTQNILQQHALAINQRFFTFHRQQRPYIILKWAQSKDAIIGHHNKRLHITNNITNRLVHQWRSEEAAILIGTNTAAADNPALKVRLATGNNPLRIVIDKQLRLPHYLQVFDGSTKTLVYNTIKDVTVNNVSYIKVADNDILPQIMQSLWQQNVQSVIIEGGAALLQSFIDANLWDEARVLTNTALQAGSGIAAPVLRNYAMTQQQHLQTDTIDYFKNNSIA